MQKLNRKGIVNKKQTCYNLHISFMDAVSGGKNMQGKMLFVSIALLVMLFFVETASAQVKVATLEQLQDALAGNDEEIIVTQTIVIDEDLTLDGGGKTVKLDRKASIQVGTGKRKEEHQRNVYPYHV
ncbi:MAG: hypothetical protein ACLR07_11225 [Christensenellales bacterium]